MADVRVEIYTTTGWQVEARARGHAFFVDEPAESGGADSAQTPKETLLAALGACTAITVRMYASRKDWPVERVHVALSYREEDGRHLIDRKVDVVGALDDAQIARLLDVANKCPVHRILTGSPVITTTLGRA